jgi:EamA domain-containing membrane protein RarD
VVLLAVLLGVGRQYGEAWQALKVRRVRLAMLASTLMIAANWYTFIWAVGTTGPCRPASGTSSTRW